jgi:uncharacterized protein (TIGR02421 family)
MVGDEDRWREAAGLLGRAAKPMRVLSTLAWPSRERETFLASGGTRLPTPEYSPPDPAPALEAVARARAVLQPGSVVDDWLSREADAVESTARMLAAIGTPAFAEHSATLYGVPTRPLRGDPTTPLDLAHVVLAEIEELTTLHLLLEPPRDRTADDVAAEIETAVRLHFGDDAPTVTVVDELSANAVASTTRIKIRRGAMFTGRDSAQLLNHEAFIHVGTGINGRAQVDLPILAVGHPGTTRTQEGLAVFSEFVSGHLDLDRLRRLALRTLAVQMVLDGADFVELYRWFLERSPSPEQAFESTRRIFRGAPLEGGAPFTKDCGYLSGLLGVTTFVRAGFAAGRADALVLLFAGKLDLTAIPALAELRARGLCVPARYVPPWALDPSWLLTYLTLSTFMSRIDLAALTGTMRGLLAQCPPVDVVFPTPNVR